MTFKRGYILANTGKNQMGKSNTALRIAQHFNRDKPLSSYLAFNSIECKELIDKAIEGTCIIYDDADVAYSSRNWRLSTSQAINEVLATCGFKHLLIIFTIRNISGLDKFARGLIDEELHHYDVGKTIAYTYNSDWGCARSKLQFSSMKKRDPELWKEYVGKKECFLKHLGKNKLRDNLLYKKLVLEGKSYRQTAKELQKEGYEVSKNTAYRFSKTLPRS